MRPVFGLLLAAMVSITATAAQQPASKHAAHAHNSDTIDGAQHPEQISDRTAWRLWLLAVSAKPNQPMTQAQEDQRMNAMLQMAGLTGEEADSFKNVLYRLRDDYTSMIEQHNKLIAEGKTDPDFTARRDALFDATRTVLENQTASREKIEKFLSSEKVHMIVSKEEEKK